MKRDTPAAQAPASPYTTRPGSRPAAAALALSAILLLGALASPAQALPPAVGGPSAPASAEASSPSCAPRLLASAVRDRVLPDTSACLDARQVESMSRAGAATWLYGATPESLCTMLAWVTGAGVQWLGAPCQEDAMPGPAPSACRELPGLSPAARRDLCLDSLPGDGLYGSMSSYYLTGLELKQRKWCPEQRESQGALVCVLQFPGVKEVLRALLGAARLPCVECDLDFSLPSPVLPLPGSPPPPNDPDSPEHGLPPVYLEPVLNPVRKLLSVPVPVPDVPNPSHPDPDFGDLPSGGDDSCGRGCGDDEGCGNQCGGGNPPPSCNLVDCLCPERADVNTGSLCTTTLCPTGCLEDLLQVGCPQGLDAATAKACHATLCPSGVVGTPSPQQVAKVCWVGIPGLEEAVQVTCPRGADAGTATACHATLCPQGVVGSPGEQEAARACSLGVPVPTCRDLTGHANCSPLDCGDGEEGQHANFVNCQPECEGGECLRVDCGEGESDPEECVPSCGPEQAPQSVCEVPVPCDGMDPSWVSDASPPGSAPPADVCDSPDACRDAVLGGFFLENPCVPPCIPAQDGDFRLESGYECEESTCDALQRFGVVQQSPTPVPDEEAGPACGAADGAGAPLVFVPVTYRIGDESTTVPLGTPAILNDTNEVPTLLWFLGVPVATMECDYGEPGRQLSCDFHTLSFAGSLLVVPLESNPPLTALWDSSQTATVAVLDSTLGVTYAVAAQTQTPPIDLSLAVAAPPVDSLLNPLVRVQLPEVVSPPDTDFADATVALSAGANDAEAFADVGGFPLSLHQPHQPGDAATAWKLHLAYDGNAELVDPATNAAVGTGRKLTVDWDSANESPLDFQVGTLNGVITDMPQSLQGAEVQHRDDGSSGFYSIHWPGTSSVQNMHVELGLQTLADFSDTPATFSLSVQARPGDAPPIQGAGLNGFLASTGSKVPWRDVLVHFKNQDGATGKPFSPSVTLAGTTVSLQDVARSVTLELQYPQNQSAATVGSSVPTFTLSADGVDSAPIAGTITIMREQEFIAVVKNLVSIKLDTRKEANRDNVAANRLQFGPQGEVSVQSLGSNPIQLQASASDETILGSLSAGCNGFHIQMKSQQSKPFNLILSRQGMNGLEIRNVTNAAFNAGKRNASFEIASPDSNGRFYLDQSLINFSSQSESQPDDPAACEAAGGGAPSKFDVKKAQFFQFVWNEVNAKVSNSWTIDPLGSIHEELTGWPSVDIVPCDYDPGQTTICQTSTATHDVASASCSGASLQLNRQGDSGELCLTGHILLNKIPMFIFQVVGPQTGVAVADTAISIVERQFQE